uniref:Uncharacterized protein n=1 Tax=Xenorhabdus bovienii str. kraussei Becker Underwood TaxID=1398204 RepID=A0A077Q1F0_XENBV|nr:hypothetical protein XBKB1_930005 [Xenorhabdus bovienii str. kraussei Becker Underwood]
MEAFKRVSDQGHRSGLAQKQGSLPDDRLMRQNHNNSFKVSQLAIISMALFLITESY